MARWKLKAPHYLMVSGTKWEYVENDRVTNKPKRVQFDVPLYLHPEDQADWNHTDRDAAGRVIDGMVVVSDGHNAHPKDIIFTSKVTPDMEPLDEEAQAITDALKASWINPMSEEALPGQGFADALLAGLQRQMADLSAGAVHPATDTGGLAEAIAAMTKTMQQQTELLTRLLTPQEEAA